MATKGEWRTDTLSPRVRVTHYVPSGYATSLQPVEMWAMAYTAPNPDHFIVGHVASSTRKGVWDQALGFFFHHADTNVFYSSKTNRNYSRHSAIRILREQRGVRVVRVKVVAL